jgi:hypothetical protein
MQTVPNGKRYEPWATVPKHNKAAIHRAGS